MGPGLLESVYRECLSHEFRLQGIPFRREHALPLHYKGFALDATFRADFLVDDNLVLEVKAVEAFAAVHAAQLLTYLRITRIRIGLLINFNVVTLVKGVRRVVNG